LNRPATRTRPDPVGVVTLTQSGPGARRASWHRTVHDLFATLDGFTAGQTVRVQIIAALARIGDGLLVAA